MSERLTSAEMHPGPGFRVRMEIPRLERRLMEEFIAEHPELWHEDIGV